MTETTNNISIIEQIKEESNRFHALFLEINKVIIGQDDILHFIVIAILCDGHILLEGLPGLAKTTMIKALTKALGLSFNRIQFTPDLLPADLIGTLIFNQKTGDFEIKKGPIFANMILADEINRAPAKVQAALLESMQECQVTIGSTTFKLDEPFLVFATQNPLEQEGTYRLPEAQVDRFMFKLLVGYPTKEQEREILTRSTTMDAINQLITKQEIISAQELVKKIYIDPKIIDYIVSLTFATRYPQENGLPSIKDYIEYGVSPRASIALYHASRAHAFLKKRHFVVPDDVKAVLPAIFRHRIGISYQAEAANMSADTIIQIILDTVIAP